MVLTTDALMVVEATDVWEIDVTVEEAVVDAVVDSPDDGEVKGDMKDIEEVVEGDVVEGTFFAIVERSPAAAAALMFKLAATCSMLKFFLDVRSLEASDEALEVVETAGLELFAKELVKVDGETVALVEGEAG